MTNKTALVTGATGFIGALLVPRLLERGWAVTVLTRDGGNLPEEWRERVNVVEGDAEEEADLRRALSGVDCAFYLIHSMNRKGDFQERDRRIARTFARAAEASGTRRIVYLGGLHPRGASLSPHMGSRVEVGEILQASEVPTTVLQAAVVLGEGSASFQMLRQLTERLPAMIAPRWLDNKVQPIAVEDVSHYLIAAAELEDEADHTLDIGMDEVFTFREMIHRYASVVGLPARPILAVPVLTPALASLWVGLVTPVASSVARPLVGSLIHDAVCTGTRADALLGPPPGGPTGFDAAIDNLTREANPRKWFWSETCIAAGAVAVFVAVAIVRRRRARC